jgi:hypothetical protein
MYAHVPSTYADDQLQAMANAEARVDYLDNFMDLLLERFII